MLDVLHLEGCRFVDEVLDPFRQPFGNWMTESSFRNIILNLKCPDIALATKSHKTTRDDVMEEEKDRTSSSMTSSLVVL
jgi:hypothetical protein